MLRHVNITPHLLLLACPPLVRLITTDHGPNTSTPVYVKGGAGLTRSTQRSAIFWVFNFPRRDQALGTYNSETSGSDHAFHKETARCFTRS